MLLATALGGRLHKWAELVRQQRHERSLQKGKTQTQAVTIVIMFWRAHKWRLANRERRLEREKAALTLQQCS